MEIMPLIVHTLSFTSSTTPNFTPGPNSGVGFLFFIAIIALIVIRRVYRGINGRRYTSGRAISLPVIYLIITFLIVVPLELENPIALTSLALIPVGVGIGYIAGRNVQFFERAGMTYYKRSPIVMVAWLISFIARLVLEFEYPNSFNVAFAIDAVLAMTSGMLVGEAVDVLRGYSGYKRGSSASQNQRDDRSVKDEDGVEMMKEL